MHRTRLKQTLTISVARLLPLQEVDRAADRDSYFPALSRILCSADPSLISPRAEEIRKAPGFVQERLSELQERLELASWDAEKCWNELAGICAQKIEEDYSSDIDFYHACRVVEAMARKGQTYIERILGLLGQKSVDDGNGPMTLSEEFLVMLAGEMRLERAIPLIVNKLHQCGELLSEDSVTALAKIGTGAAAEAVTEGWLESEWDYRLYATSALRAIHSDTTVQKCLELLPQDRDEDIRTKLAYALLGQFAADGIEPVRQLVEQKDYAEASADLKSHLVAVSTVLGVAFPEYSDWKREAEEKRATTERRMKERQGLFYRAPTPELPKEPDEAVARKPAPFVRAEKQIGRNDPCPCGSGKKFKKCCMNQE